MKPDSDILVIGGGVIGVCSAYYLAKEGRQVTILERDDICSGCSYGNAGWVVPSHSVPLARPGVIRKALGWMLNPESPFYVKPRFDLDLFRWLWRFRAAANERTMREKVPFLSDLTRASLALYDGLVAEEELECDYGRNGLLVLFKTAEGYREGLEEAHLVEQNGVHMRELTPEEVLDMEPNVRPDISGGIFYRDEAHLNPWEFVTGLAERFQQRGGSIQTGTEVVGFETSGTRIVAVRTTRGDYRPEQVVLAAGSWTPSVARDLRLDLPVQPAKGYSVTFDKPENCPAVPLMLAEAKMGVTPMGPLMRLAGTLELSGINLKIDSRRVGAMLRTADDYLVADIASMSGRTWCGMRPATPDTVPIIGPTDSYSNLFIATGHSMTGVTLGPVTGKLIAQLACGQAPMLDPRPLSPARFQR